MESTARRPFAPDATSVLDADELREVIAPFARAILLHAGLLGVAADLLLRDGFTGPGFPIWLLLLASSTISLVWRDGRPLSVEGGAWLAVAVVFGSAMAWRGSQSLQLFDFLATLLALGMTAAALGDPRAGLFAQRMRDTLWAGARVIRSVAIGIIPLALRDVALPIDRQELSGRFRPALRAALIAFPLLFVFGSLLRSADPVFASIVALPEIDMGEFMSHVVVFGFFTWVAAGWARGALLVGVSGARAPERLPFSAGRTDVTTALGVLNLLFGIYVLTQLGWFFGGERFLQDRTGLTAAQYARQGFFQMVWVVLLVVPLLLGTRAALRPEKDLERWHTALSLPLLGLLGVMIVSALLRMRLYVQYYGLTIDRLYPLVFMAWLTLVLAWLAVTVLRGHGRSFAGGATVAGLLILAALNVFVPDVIVARVNIARAQPAGPSPGPRLDLEYLAQLGAEAVPLAVAAVLAPPARAGAPPGIDEVRDRCHATGLLLRRWRPEPNDIARRELRGTGWRSWNRGEEEAMRVVRSHATALLTAQRESCARLRELSPAERGGAPAPPVPG
jgi:hypothetical protein